jgi:DNA topoisomerase VI subunit A
MSFIHSLLLSNRTTTTREVYYVFVTHFRNQKECDSAILDVAKCLGVPRRALGLSASPKGVFLNFQLFACPCLLQRTSLTIFFRLVLREH